MYCNPGIDRSDFAGRQLRRARDGAGCPGGEWRSADQRPPNGTGFDPGKYFWCRNRFFHVCDWATTSRQVQRGLLGENESPCPEEVGKPPSSSCKRSVE